MKKIGICTLFTGYNYGSALQAFALKEFVKQLGYDCDIIKLSGSLVKGRDFRVKKAVITLFRILLHSKNKKNVLKSFMQNNKSFLNEKIVKEFDSFYNHYINPVYYDYKALKKIAITDYYSSFICGSDQIWNSTAFYIDPFYFLQFAPQNKRIAYAPSFGRDFIPNYNKNKLKKFISSFESISIREESGCKIINDLLGIDVPVCIDPTFLIDKKIWIEKLGLSMNKEKYILAYFLNKPTSNANDFMQYLSNSKNIKIVYVGNGFENGSLCGPIGFLNLLYNASYVITDSFHGVAFSINFNKKFWVFDRNYTTENQSTRIINLLGKVGLEDRFEPTKESINNDILYEEVNYLLHTEVDKSKDYLKEKLVKNER